MVRKHCGKRRNCSLRAISPFPTVFSKSLYRRHVKTRACLGDMANVKVFFDKQMDKRTYQKLNVYAPDLSMGGHKNDLVGTLEATFIA